jgi:hypothetical protein
MEDSKYDFIDRIATVITDPYKNRNSLNAYVQLHSWLPGDDEETHMRGQFAKRLTEDQGMFHAKFQGNNAMAFGESRMKPGDKVVRSIELHDHQFPFGIVLRPCHDTRILGTSQSNLFHFVGICWLLINPVNGPDLHWHRPRGQVKRQEDIVLV